MPKTLEFYFDFGSPAAYLAHTQLPQLSAETGAQVVYKPMLLGGVFQSTGNQPPNAVVPKGAYVFTDFSRFAKRYGVPLVRNANFPIITTTLMRGAVGLQLQGDARFADYMDVVYKAIWVDNENMNDPAVVGAVLTRNGFDAAALVALTQEPAVKDALKAVTTAAVARGIFGAPTMFVGDAMFWGQDRLDFVREALLA